MKLDEKITLVLLIWNVMVFLIYGIDKSKARRRAWRIPEKILLILALSWDGDYTSSLICYLEVMDGRKIDF